MNTYKITSKSDPDGWAYYVHGYDKKEAREFIFYQLDTSEEYNVEKLTIENPTFASKTEKGA